MALILPGTAQVHKGGGVKLGALGVGEPGLSFQDTREAFNLS